jgi:hypothetical protein
MKQLNLDLKNCYGIRELAAKFDFVGCKAKAIYAPNGAMKSSLAKTFQDIAANTASKDRIFPARECTGSIKDEIRLQQRWLRWMTFCQAGVGASPKRFDDVPIHPYWENWFRAHRG